MSSYDLSKRHFMNNQSLPISFKASFRFEDNVPFVCEKSTPQHRSPGIVWYNSSTMLSGSVILNRIIVPGSEKITV